MNAVDVLAAGLSPVDEEGNYHPPEIGEFFPSRYEFFGVDLPFTRIHLVQLIATLALVLFFVLATRRMTVVPGRLQNMAEVAVNFVRNQIVDSVMGTSGRKYLPLFVTIFFTILALNLTGVVPFLNMPGTAVIAVPLLFAVISYLAFNISGIKEHGLGGYLKLNLFPPGVPKPIYLLVTPIEFASTFLLRPVTLTVRLLANMVAGHLMLVLFFGGTSYLLFEAAAALKPLAALSLAAGFGFTLFELLVAFLQAYIFALLTAVYLAGAVAHEH